MLFFASDISLGCSSQSYRFRAGAGVTVLDGCLYAIGGFDDNAPLPSCERYDPVNDRWQLLTPMSCPRGSLLLNFAYFHGKVKRSTCNLIGFNCFSEQI